MGTEYAGVDSGGEVRDAIKSTKSKGVGEEFFWPYDTSKFMIKPPSDVYTNAVLHESIKYFSVPVNANAVKQVLADGFPVVVGIEVFAGFESLTADATGVVAMPKDGEKDEGGHCIYVVGYGQNPGYFTLRNSWGMKYGDKGDYYIPEEYLVKYGSDFWVITSEMM